MAAAVDDYARFDALDHGFHRILMRASASEIGSTIVAAIHDYARGTATFHSAGGVGTRSRTRSPSTARSSRRSRRATASSRPTRMVAHIESAWVERQRSFRQAGRVRDGIERCVRIARASRPVGRGLA